MAPTPLGTSFSPTATFQPRLPLIFSIPYRELLIRAGGGSMQPSREQFSRVQSSASV
jgi:hypothetical protein